MVVVIASILETICESHYYFRVIHHPDDASSWERAPNPADYRPSIPGCPCLTRANLSMADYPVTEAHPYLAVLDDICIVSQPRAKLH